MQEECRSAVRAAPKGFNVCEDRSDGYQFVYPFGWQEVAVTGADVVFKDIVEPLESVSVSLAKTQRGSVTEFGAPQEVRVREALPAPSALVASLGSEAEHSLARSRACEHTKPRSLDDLCRWWTSCPYHGTPFKARLSLAVPPPANLHSPALSFSCTTCWSFALTLNSRLPRGQPPSLPTPPPGC
jgi:hypothetical protein